MANPNYINTLNAAAEKDLDDKGLTTKTIPTTQVGIKELGQEPTSEDTYGLTKENYDDAIAGGIDEATLKAVHGYDPNNPDPVMSQIWSANKKKPTPLSEEGLKAQRIASSLGDTFGSLAEMFAAGRGAHVKANQGATNTEKAALKERDMRRLYEQQLDQFEDGEIKAKMSDFQNAENNYRLGRSEIQKAIQTSKSTRWNKSKLDQSQSNTDREYNRKLESDKINQANKKKELEIRASNKAKGSSESSKASEKGGIFITALPNDPKATTDEIGNKVRKYNLSKDEILNYATRAKGDKKFRAEKDDDISVTTTDYSGTHKGLTSDLELARIYLQYLYDNEHKEEQPKSNIKVPQMVPTKKVKGF